MKRPDPDTIDPAAIESVLRIGGTDLLERLVTVAEDNVRRRLDQLEEALGASPPDLAAAERAAHSIKSSAAYLGAEALREHAAGIEDEAREGLSDGPSDGLAGKVREARRLLERVLPALRDEIGRRKDAS